jgi:hypothetical protein
LSQERANLLFCGRLYGRKYDSDYQIIRSIRAFHFKVLTMLAQPVLINPRKDSLSTPTFSSPSAAKLPTVDPHTSMEQLASFAVAYCMLPFCIVPTVAVTTVAVTTVAVTTTIETCVLGSFTDSCSQWNLCSFSPDTPNTSHSPKIDFNTVLDRAF